MAIDPAERVYDGQIGTGDATPYLGSGGNPIIALQSTLGAGRRTKSSGENIRNPDFKPKWWARHNTELAQDVKKLDDIGAQLTARGINPYDKMNGQVYEMYYQDQQKVLRKAELSKQLEADYNEVLKQYNQSPGKYDKKVFQDIEAFYNRSLDETLADVESGVMPPSLQAYEVHDRAGYLTSIGAAVLASGYEGDPVKKGDLYISTRTKGKDVNSLREVTYADLLSKGEDHIDYRGFATEYEKLPDGKRETYNKLAQDKGIDPVVYYAGEITAKAQGGKDISKSTTNVPDSDFFGSGAGKKAIELSTRKLNTRLTGLRPGATEEERKLAIRELAGDLVGRKKTIPADPTTYGAKDQVIEIRSVSIKKRSDKEEWLVAEDFKGVEHPLYRAKDLTANVLNNWINENPSTEVQVPNEFIMQQNKSEELKRQQAGGKSDPLGLRTTDPASSTKKDPLGIR
jgi:hypothetical protein